MDPSPILISLARRMWVNLSSGKVLWEDKQLRIHNVYVLDTGAFIRCLRKAGWKGGGSTMSLLYYWRPEPKPRSGSANIGQLQRTVATTIL